MPTETDVKNLKINLIQGVSAVTVLIVAVYTGLSWANEIESEVEKVARAQQATLERQQSVIDALIKSQERDQELLKEAADNAQENREALIRIEAKLEE